MGRTTGTDQDIHEGQASGAGQPPTLLLPRSPDPSPVPGKPEDTA